MIQPVSHEGDTRRRRFALGISLGLVLMCPAFPTGLKASSEAIPFIHFQFHPIAFVLDSCETPEKHAPETMAGGTAVFDYDNDGNPDIFFTNGADITSLKKHRPNITIASSETPGAVPSKT